MNAISDINADGAEDQVGGGNHHKQRDPGNQDDFQHLGDDALQKPLYIGKNEDADEDGDDGGGIVCLGDGQAKQEDGLAAGHQFHQGGIAHGSR